MDGERREILVFLIPYLISNLALFIIYLCYLLKRLFSFLLDLGFGFVCCCFALFCNFEECDQSA